MSPSAASSKRLFKNLCRFSTMSMQGSTVSIAAGLPKVHTVSPVYFPARESGADSSTTVRSCVANLTQPWKSATQRSLQTTKPAEHECPARWKAKQAASQSPRNARNWLTEMMPLSSRNSQVQISRRSEAKLYLLPSKVAMSKLRRWSGKERRCLDSPP